jgi:hypothetical protein
MAHLDAQERGVEVGLVAKLAGDKNAVVTLSHYPSAIRGVERGEGARQGVRVDGKRRKQP